VKYKAQVMDIDHLMYTYMILNWQATISEGK